MNKALLRTAAIAVLALTFGASALAYQGEKLAAEAKITIDQARVKAVAVCPGKIVDEELEREKGGSGLRYSFDIRKDGKTYEVGVDAVTGKILENAPEGANPD